MSSDPQLALLSCVGDVLLRTLYQLIPLFVVEFYGVQFLAGGGRGLFYTTIFAFTWGFEEHHEGPHSGDRCSS
jgi:hypothetical protein